MKTTALVGFTWPDAFGWIATECRARGCSVMIGSNQKYAWMRDETIVIVKTEAEALEMGVDQVITRASMEVGA